MHSSVHTLELDQALRKTGETGQHLRWDLLRHFGHIIRGRLKNTGDPARNAERISIWLVAFPLICDDETFCAIWVN